MLGLLLLTTEVCRAVKPVGEKDNSTNTLVAVEERGTAPKLSYASGLGIAPGCCPFETNKIVATPLTRDVQRWTACADTELVGDADIEAVEERLEAAEDDGVALEPFNLEQERREGFFDEGGHYVEKKDEEEGDAWLASGEGAPNLLHFTCHPRLALVLAPARRCMHVFAASPLPKLTTSHTG